MRLVCVCVRACVCIWAGVGRCQRNCKFFFRTARAQQRIAQGDACRARVCAYNANHPALIFGGSCRAHRRTGPGAEAAQGSALAHRRAGARLQIRREAGAFAGPTGRLRLESTKERSERGGFPQIGLANPSADGRTDGRAHFAWHCAWRTNSPLVRQHSSSHFTLAAAAAAAPLLLDAAVRWRSSSQYRLVVASG